MGSVDREQVRSSHPGETVGICLADPAIYLHDHPVISVIGTLHCAGHGLSVARKQQGHRIEGGHTSQLPQAFRCVRDICE